VNGYSLFQYITPAFFRPATVKTGFNIFFSHFTVFTLFPFFCEQHTETSHLCVYVCGEHLHACWHMHVFLFNCNLFSYMTDNYKFFL